MRRSACLMLSAAALALSFSAHALTSQNIDPRDPSIWEEKPSVDQPRADNPCEVFTSSVCPNHEDEKSAIQRERERREQRRFQNEMERYLKK